MKVAEGPILDVRPFVDGRRVEADAGAVERVNPADGSELVAVRNCSAEMVSSAVAASRRAQPVWQNIGLSQRKRLLLTCADAIDASARRLGAFDCLEMGKPISAAVAEAGVAAAFFRYYAEAIDKRYGATAPGGNDTLETQVRNPMGVVAAITPWNYPVINVALKVAPVLAAGNGVVVKPSEYSVGSALEMAHACCEAGLPAGLFNVVTGNGQTGASLASHPGVDMVTFTGSTETGRHILAASGAQRMRPVALECGGKCPQIVFADILGEVDPQALASSLAHAALANQGQLCVSRARILIEEPVCRLLTERIVEACASFTPGDPGDPSTTFGPLANARQYEKSCDFVRIGVKQGGVLELDGRESSRDRNGFYLAPSIFSGVDQCDDVVQREIFGPVLSVQSFNGEAEAVRMANDTDYGLAATVWTAGYARAHRVASQLRAGTVHVNATTQPLEGSGLAHAAEPFGQSGFGVEGGMHGLDTYSRLKATVFNFGRA